MLEPSAQAQPSDDQAWRGVQYDLVCRGSGLLAFVGAVASLALLPFFPPTAAIGAVGWALVLPSAALSLVMGALRITLRLRPSVGAIRAAAFVGVVQIGALQWLAGGGKAPYIQLLLLPTLGAAVSQPVRRCAQVLLVAAAAALSPLLYSTIDVPSTVVELSLLSLLTLFLAFIIESTRTHRARLRDEGEHANVLAHVDPLTGMLNRRAFDETLALAIESARIGGTPISLLLCDVNSFKDVNDTFGHAVGDEVLQSIATALSDAVRRPDSAFRWAGDEFAVILRDTDAHGADRVGARIREAVRERCTRADGRSVTIATGLAELQANMSREEFLVTADRALFSEKARRSQLSGVA